MIALPTMNINSEPKLTQALTALSWPSVCSIPVQLLHNRIFLAHCAMHTCMIDTRKYGSHAEQCV